MPRHSAWLVSAIFALPASRVEDGPGIFPQQKLRVIRAVTGGQDLRALIQTARTPLRVMRQTGLSLGGTSIIIVVGVALETFQALESQMLMRHYKGFLE